MAKNSIDVESFDENGKPMHFTPSLWCKFLVSMSGNDSVRGLHHGIARLLALSLSQQNSYISNPSQNVCSILKPT